MVYLAEDPVIGRQVAIKVVKSDPGLAEEEVAELQTRFEREFQSAGTLNHPNIVTVFDVGKEGGDPFFAMEFLPGEDLADIMKSDKVLSFKEIADFGIKICAALDFAHDHGVVHRDIKPANILIDRNQEPKVTDFGVAKLTSTNLTRTGTVVGTPSYMSPEQVTGQQVSGASDQFSVAIILYQMLTGELPFTGENPTTILYKIVHETPVGPHEKRTSLPPQIDKVLLRALEKKPETRYPRCADLASAVRDALGVAAQELDLAFDQPESTLQMRHQRVRRKRGSAKNGHKIWLWLAAAAVAIAVAAFLFVGGGSEKLGGLITGVTGGGGPRTLTRTLVVQGDQGGAEIWRSGASTGLFVPAELTLKGNEGEEVLLELRRQGHVVASTTLIIDPAMAQEWTAVESALPTQTFTVATRPEGAKVFLNDELLADSTPVEIALTSGLEYQIRVELDQYHAESLGFAFPDGLEQEVIDSERFFFPLRAVIPPGHLIAEASFPVKIEVGGRSYGPKQSHNIALKPDSYEVTLSSDKLFLNERVLVEVGSNGRAELRVPEPVQFRVAAQPGNCNVYINDRLIDETPFNQTLVPGVYQFRYEWPALSESRTSTETISAGTTEIFGFLDSR